MTMVKKVFLMCAIAVSAALATSIPRDNSPSLFRLFRHPARAAASPRALSKAAALEWKKIASMQYFNSGFFGLGVNWNLSSRDTVIYDALGHMVVTKTSIAGSGWSSDSLLSIDSCVYVNNWLAEEIQEDFDTYGTGAVNYGYKDIYTERNNGTVMVSVHFDWNTTKKIWEATSRDSLILSGPFSRFTVFDISILVKEVAWSFDTVKGDWKITTDVTRIDSECTPTTYVMAGMASFTGGDSLFETRMIMNFNSPARTTNTLSDETVLQKDPGTGVYHEVMKFLMTYDKNGFITSEETLMWDTLTQSLRTLDKSVTLPDSHGNDTLSFDSFFDTTLGEWDTSGLTRYKRLYDANGNNASVVASDFDNMTGTWYAQTKDTVVFAQVNSAVLRAVTPAVSKEIVMKKTAASVRFTAPGISGLRLYDVTGRLLVSMSQKPGPFIEFGNASILSGTYVARVKAGDREMFFKVPILR